jgi:3-hydroxybutyryl-CoA dehydratase
MKPDLLENELSIGRTFEGSMTVTETHIVMGAGLIGGFQLAHIDQEYARSRGLKGTILHGSLTAAIMSTVVGRNLTALGWTVLEQSTRYRAVVYADDTLKIVWTASKHSLAPKLKGWIVELEGVCANQDKVVVAASTMSLLVMAPGKVAVPSPAL